MDRSGWARRIPIRNGGPCRGHVAVLFSLSSALPLFLFSFSIFSCTSFIRGVSHDQVYLPCNPSALTHGDTFPRTTYACCVRVHTYANLQHTAIDKSPRHATDFPAPFFKHSTEGFLATCLLGFSRLFRDTRDNRSIFWSPLHFTCFSNLLIRNQITSNFTLHVAIST